MQIKRNYLWSIRSFRQCCLRKVSASFPTSQECTFRLRIITVVPIQCTGTTGKSFYFHYFFYRTDTMLVNNKFEVWMELIQINLQLWKRKINKANKPQQQNVVFIYFLYSKTQLPTLQKSLSLSFLTKNCKNLGLKVWSIDWSVYLSKRQPLCTANVNNWSTTMNWFSLSNIYSLKFFIFISVHSTRFNCTSFFCSAKRILLIFIKDYKDERFNCILDCDRVNIKELDIESQLRAKLVWKFNVSS